MTTQKEPTQSVSATVSNISGGSIAIGNTVTQSTTSTTTTSGVTPEQLAALRHQFAELRTQLDEDPEIPDEANAKLRQLEDAVTADPPDVNTMERVRNWFLKHAPKVAGSVMALVVNPVVGALVAATGDAAASEFRRRFVDD